MNSKNQSFEQSMQRLEEIVRAMEKGDIELEQSLQLFQEGTALIQKCSQLLENAQLQVKKIIVQPDGSPAEEAFTDEP